MKPEHAKRIILEEMEPGAISKDNLDYIYSHLLEKLQEIKNGNKADLLFTGECLEREGRLVYECMKNINLTIKGVENGNNKNNGEATA